MRIDKLLVALAIGGATVIAVASCGDDASPGLVSPDGGLSDAGIPPPSPPPTPQPPPMPPYVTTPGSNEGR